MLAEGCVIPNYGVCTIQNILLLQSKLSILLSVRNPAMRNPAPIASSDKLGCFSLYVHILDVHAAIWASCGLQCREAIPD